MTLDYQCYVALLTHQQSGEVDYDTWGSRQYHSRRRYRWRDHDDPSDAVGDDSGVEMGEVYEEERSLDHWLDPHGRKQPFGQMHLEENEILCPEGTEHWSVEQEIHEATGNEGVSVERSYRQGVIVIWPRDRYFAILAGEGQTSAIPALEQMAERSKSGKSLAACRTFADEIIGHWKPRHRIVGTGEFHGSARMLKVLERVGTAELVGRFLQEVFPKDFDGSEGENLVRLFERFGWEPYAAALREFLAQQKPENYFTRLEQIVSICVALCCDPPALAEERRAVCASLADPLAEVVDRWDAKRAQFSDVDDFDEDEKWGDEKRTGVVANVLRILGTIGATRQLDQFLTHVLTRRQRYSLRRVLIPDVKAISEWISKVPAAHPVASTLWQHCLGELRAATARPIVPPQDWTRDANLGCRCEDCQMLSRFLSDAAQQVARFPLRKDRRQHLHQQIDKHRLDLTHVTDRVGSPQTLVCTKTQASYQRRQIQFEIDKKLLAGLEALEGLERPRAVKTASGRRTTRRK